MPRRSKIQPAALLIACLVFEQSCLFKKSPPKATIVIPPAPPPQPPAPLPAPPTLPPAETRPAARNAEIPTLPPPPSSKTPARKTPPRKTTATTKPAETQTNPPAEAVAAPTAPALVPNPTPSLQPILGTREIEERNQRIQRYLDKARLVVLKAERSQPDERTRQLIAQVRTFLQQAEESRKVDLVRAENLAERAEVLSRGLIR